MINITYMPLKDVNKLRILYGEGHIKALAGKVFWMGEDEKRYIMEIKIDIKPQTHSQQTKATYYHGDDLSTPLNEHKTVDTPELARGGGKPTIHKSSGTLNKWKECEGCGVKVDEGKPEFDFLVCPNCDTDLEEFEIDEEVEAAADLRRKYGE